MKITSLILSVLLLPCSSDVWAYITKPQFKNGVCVICRAPGQSYRYKDDDIYWAIDKTGKILTDKVASSTYMDRNLTDAGTKIMLKDGSSFDTEDGKLIPEKTPEGLRYYSVFEKDGKMGLKESQSQAVAIEPEFDDFQGHQMWNKKERWLHPNSNSISIKKNGKWGLFDLDTKKITVPIKYDSVALTGQLERVYAVLNGKEWAYYSKDLEKEIANGFILALSFSENKAVAFIDEKNAVAINEAGKEILRFECDRPVSAEDRAVTFSAGSFYVKHGLIPVWKDGKFGILNDKGKEVQPFEYDQIGGYGDGAFRDGMARFVKDGKVGFFDSSGKVAIDPKWDDGSGLFSDGLAYVVAGRSWGFIDKSGKMVIGPNELP